MITHREAFALNAMTSEGGCLTVTPALHKKDGASWESMIAAGYVQRRALGVNVVMMPGDSLRITEAGIALCRRSRRQSGPPTSAGRQIMPGLRPPNQRRQIPRLLPFLPRPLPRSLPMS